MSSQRVLPSPPPLKPESGLPGRRSTRPASAPADAANPPSVAEKRHRLGNIIMIFFLRQYLSSVPDSIIEAARIDGASFLQIFFRLIFPVIKPAIAAQFILWFMAVWNDYLAPIIYLNSPEVQTLQLVIANFNAQYAIQTDYPLIMAASFVALLPVLIVFIVFQRQIIESIALTGSKG